MNIFKILANGDGSINEPNVSAFLGYLLNPYEDHGLGFEFLSRFLDLLNDDLPERGEEESNNLYNYEYEVALEAAFQGDMEFANALVDKRSRKQIVDIVILQFEPHKKGESYVSRLLRDRREISKVFLIENKIRDAKDVMKQLEAQFQATKETLATITKDIEITSICITPTELSVSAAGGSDFKYYGLTWKGEKSVYTILKNLIKEESIGNIESINTYTRHTLISFIKFIENDFKSQVQEKKEKKAPGEYTKFFIDLNLKTDIDAKLKKLREEILKRNPEWQISLLAPKYGPMEPKLVFELDEIDIGLYAGARSRDNIRFFYQSNGRCATSFGKLKQIADRLKIDIKREKYEKNAYASTKEMRMPVSIHDYENIFMRLRTFIEQSDV